MQSKRREDYAKKSQSSKLPNHPHRIEACRDSYTISRRDAVDRSPSRPRSPHGEIEGSRRVLLREGRSSSTERRESSWHPGASRIEKVRVVSPSYLQDRKKPQFDEGIVYRRHRHDVDIDYDDGQRNRLKQVYEYNHHGAPSRMSKEKDYKEKAIVDMDEHEMMEHKLGPLEDEIIRRQYREPPDLVPISDYVEIGQRLPLSSQSMDIEHDEHQKLRYQEPLPSDKIPVRELYEQEDEHMFHSRGVPYSMVPVSHSKDYGNSSEYKEYAGTSSGVPSSYRQGVPLPAHEEYPRSSVKLTEPVDFNTHGRRSVMDISDHEAGKRTMTSYPVHSYSPNRVEHDDYGYLKSVNDDRAYPFDDLRRMMPPQSRLDYEHDQTDYKHTEFSRSNINQPVVDTIVSNVDSFGNIQKSSVWDRTVIDKQAASENPDTNKIIYEANHGGKYLDAGYSEVEFERIQLLDNESYHFGVPQDRRIQHLRSDYGFERETSPQFLNERLPDPSISIYDLEMERLPIKRHRMEEEFTIYEPSDKMLKRKYSIEEDVRKHDRGTIVSRKWNTSQEFEDLYDSGEEWIHEDTSALHASRNRRFNHNVYSKVKRIYDRHDHVGDFESEGRLSSRDSLVHTQRHSTGHYKQNFKYTKTYPTRGHPARNHPRSGSLTWYNSHKIDRRSAMQRNKSWKRNDGFDETAEANDNGPFEDWGNPPESEASEDSEEFKQLVDEAFLAFSKRLNLKSAVQRKYKEEGKAGSLFCIVCGKSLSKEFMDTRRLVTHAFMSHKVGLRAQHLGLHKAICVLMGWSTYIPSDTITWVPEVLPDTEAWAQKEDLILWPPLVIIHNISMSSNNPEEQKVVPIEGVEAFLRAKGIVGGKTKVCLGKPADQSVMLVKFLGTFTGLGNAEKLHTYFAENQHGREEFERKSNGGWKEGMVDNLEEHLLYGYLGIAEDLDRLDFNTKKWIFLKSKKEIQDLENAPVKLDDR